MSIFSPRRILAIAVSCALMIALLAGCSGAADHSFDGKGGSTPRPLTSAEAERLAIIRFNFYQSKVIAVSGTIVSGSDTVDLEGWVDTVNHEGYGLVRPPGGTGFLTIWNPAQVGAQDYSGEAIPLPHPESGWNTADLKASDSALAAGQLLLVSLSNDRPDNPQLLLQGGATWLRSDTIDGVSVDIMTGPLATGATESNLRYWVDADGQLRRLEAHLGRDWSTFTFTPAPDTTF